MNRAVKAQGIWCPIIREGDNIVDIVVDNVLSQFKQERWCINGDDLMDPLYTYEGLNDKDIIGITESVVARAAGQYITVDDIAADIEKKFGKDATICLVNPIYSRNRFSMILKGIARAAKKVIIVMPEYDEVGNPRGTNPFTGVNIEEYYRELCENENCECKIVHHVFDIECKTHHINCNLHIKNPHDTICEYHFLSRKYTLADICSDKSPNWGILGTNKATEEKLKLFPSKAECKRVCEAVKTKIKEKTGKDVIVCVYGDGCFKDPIGGIWEFADPVTMPYYTDKKLIESTPCEVKLKYMIDNTGKGSNANGTSAQISDCIIKHKLEFAKKNNVAQMGTTPRVYRDLIASLMDLTSGSGDRQTPVVLIQNYF